MADTGVVQEVAPQDEHVVGDGIAFAAGDNKRKLDDLEPRDAMADTGVVQEVAPQDEHVVGDGIAFAAGDNKRKLHDLEPRDEEGETPLKKQEVLADNTTLPAAADGADLGGGDAEKATGADGQIDGSRLDADEALLSANETKADGLKDSDSRGDGIREQDPTGGVVDKQVDVEHQQKDEVNGSVIEEDQEVQKLDVSSTENGQLTSANDAQTAYADAEPTSRRMEVPNSKVGVLIGKAGETIKYLQHNSGAKIQITRDAEADLNSSTRPVELIGTRECIDRAEKLIKDVIAEADAGGSPSLVARGFGTLQSGGEQMEIKVPNEKVGLIIGKGGETIKNLQTRSGARIQLIPQHLPEGDSSKERTVRITGNRKQIDAAKEMIKDAMNQTAMRPSPLSGGYNQHNFRPRGPSNTPQWGAHPPTQPTMGYDYQQGGMYPPQQSTQHRQSYGGYQQQYPPRGGYGTGWDQRPAPGQSTPAGGGYDYYNQGSHAAGPHSSNPMPNPNSSMHPGPMNYNYGQSQTPNYGQPTSTQPNYSQGYNDPKYGGQAPPSQQYYGQQPMQSGGYGQQASAPQYGQPQSYNKPAYGLPPQDAPAYGPQRATQPGDPMYQGSAQTYAAPSQPYPYGSNAPQQQTPGYNQAYPNPGATDVYAQQPVSYVQQGGPVAPPAYGQGGQPVPAYTQPGSQPPAAYGQYPSSQQNYGDPAAGGANYGYHGGSVDAAAYGATAPTAAYGATPAGSNQPGYVQAAPNPSGYYEQPAPQ